MVLEAAAGKNAADPVALNLRGIASFTDCFVICGGNQRRQTQAICDAIVERMAQEGQHPLNVEGYRLGDWILIDFSDLVVHIFTPGTRDFYNLERLWGDAPRVAIGRPGGRTRRGVSSGRKC